MGQRAVHGPLKAVPVRWQDCLATPLRCAETEKTQSCALPSAFHRISWLRHWFSMHHAISFRMSKSGWDSQCIVAANVHVSDFICAERAAQILHVFFVSATLCTALSKRVTTFSFSRLLAVK